MANGRCRYHGGKSLTGVANPAYRDGRHSKYLPVRLAARYGQSLLDPDYLALRDELALVDARISELSESLPDSEEIAQTWESFRAHFAGAASAYDRSRDSALAPEKRAEAQTEFFQRFEAALLLFADAKSIEQRGGALWDKIGDWLERRRKLSETEALRVSKAAESISRDRLAALMGAIAQLIRANVRDPATLNALQDGLRRLCA
jgi:hypothetical protein